MHLVGLTGGIGSGKSTVAARLADHGIVVVDADRLAREVVEPGEPVLAALAERFGADVLDGQGRLDRALLAERAFADAEGKAALDAITHPAIAERLRSRLDALEAAGEPVAVLDHPLLVETGSVALVDTVVVVEADPELRVSRLVERGLDEADARARLAAQADDDTRRRHADHVLHNDGDLPTLHAAVDELLVHLVGDLDPQPARR